MASYLQLASALLACHRIPTSIATNTWKRCSFREFLDWPQISSGHQHFNVQLDNCSEAFAVSGVSLISLGRGPSAHNIPLHGRIPPVF